ncbi:MAG TPA: cyclic nucleotide-binding domain-containing protein [Anaerolineales bacterium]
MTRFPLFNDLSSADLEIIAPLFYARTYNQGATIIEQGEKATCLYLLTSGKVELHYKPYDGQPIKLTSVYAGSAFGWSSVLGKPVYSSTVVCASDCEVLMICGSDLRALRDSNPRTGAQIMERLARSVSARWPNAQAQVRSMIHKGVAENIPPMGKGEENMNTPVTSPKEEQLKVLLSQLSAYIEQFHGGSVDFVAYEGDTLKVHLGGACLGCPLSPSTLHGWVEGTVKQFFPEIKHVEPA